MAKFIGSTMSSNACAPGSVRSSWRRGIASLTMPRIKSEACPPADARAFIARSHRQHDVLERLRAWIGEILLAAGNRVVDEAADQERGLPARRRAGVHRQIAWHLAAEIRLIARRIAEGDERNAEARQRVG